jgi:predicted PurR-regulated permease PerM
MSARRFGSENPIQMSYSGFNPKIYRVVVHGREVDLSESAVNYYRSIGVEVGTPQEIVPKTAVITTPTADQGWNPVADLTEWLTGGADHISQGAVKAYEDLGNLSTNLQNEAENLISVANQGIQQANTWVDQNYPTIMEEISKHGESITTQFEEWAKNEELKQQKTWEDFAKAFGSGTGQISTFLTGGGIGFVIAIVLLAVIMMRGGGK